MQAQIGTAGEEVQSLKISLEERVVVTVSLEQLIAELRDQVTELEATQGAHKIMHAM